jgi:hypothetical protein
MKSKKKDEKQEEKSTFHIFTSEVMIDAANGLPGAVREFGAMARRRCIRPY